MRLPLLLAAALLAHAACALAAHNPEHTLDRFKDKEPITDKSMLGAEPKMKDVEAYDPTKRLNPLEEGLGYVEKQKPVTLKPDEALKQKTAKGDDNSAKSEGLSDGLSITDDDDGIMEPRYLRYGSYQQPVYTQQQPFVQSQQPLINTDNTIVPARLAVADDEGRIGGFGGFGRGFGGFGRGFGFGRGWGWGGARALRGGFGWGRGFGGWGRGFGWGRGYGWGGLGYGGLYGGYYGGYGYPYYGGYGYGIGYPYTTYYTAPYYGYGAYGYGFPAWRGVWGGRRFGRWW